MLAQILDFCPGRHAAQDPVSARNTMTQLLSAVRQVARRRAAQQNRSQERRPRPNPPEAADPSGIAMSVSATSGPGRFARILAAASLLSDEDKAEACEAFPGISVPVLMTFGSAGP